jgi:hypothetical protein
MLNLDSRANRSLTSVRFVTHKGKSMKISITTKHGQRALKIPSRCTMDRPWTPNHLKTTRFRESNPVVEVKKGQEPPF